MPHPLDGPLRKVTRARDHLDALNRSVGAYLDDPHTIRVTEQLDRERDEMVWHMTIPVNPSWSFSLMAGDAIHNLRSALDLLAVQLVIANGGKRFVQRATSFPLYGSYSVSNTLRFWNAVLGMDTEAADIIDALQPYNGGQLPELLGLLSALDNAQKHRLIPIASTELKLLVYDPQQRLRVRQLNDGSLELRMPRQLYQRHGQAKPQASTTVLFGPKETSLTTLTLVYEAVYEGVIPSLARFLS